MTTDHGLPTTAQKPPLVTTYLEMRSPEQLRPKRCADAKFQVREQKEPNWVFNRDLYFAVGEQWQWTDKRPWTDDQWKEYAFGPELRTFAAYYDGELAGYYADYQTPRLDLARALASGFVYQGEISEFWGKKPRGEKSDELPPATFVNFLQNHDQIGNRPLGDRLESLASPKQIEPVPNSVFQAPENPR